MMDVNLYEDNLEIKKIRVRGCLVSLSTVLAVHWILCHVPQDAC